MKNRYTLRPSPVISVIAAVVGVFMLVFGISMFSQGAKGVPAPLLMFLVVWVVALIGIIIYHVTNAIRAKGVPTEIIESEDAGPKSSTQRLEELADLRTRNLISDAEYETKRQKILSEL